MKCIKSNYRDGEQFKMEIIGETEEELILMFLPEYRNTYEDGNGIHKLRKSLVGNKENLYSYCEIKYIQEKLF